MEFDRVVVPSLFVKPAPRQAALDNGLAKLVQWFQLSVTEVLPNRRTYINQ